MSKARIPIPLLLLALFALALAACAPQPAVDTPVATEPAGEPTDAPAEEPGGEVSGPGGDRSGIRIIVVSHGQAADPFWSVVKNGVDQAAADMGVTVEYQAPQTF
ncbi:MAG: LacI family transcriptional regulator, partial [Candidatus Promineifilaceae bacterium]